MRKFIFILLVFYIITNTDCFPQSKIDSLLPIRGFCIGAPKPTEVDEFVKFIKEELASRKVNALILRVDFNYQFNSHPELRDSVALSLGDVKKMVKACQQNNIRIIPQINLLGHQSWASKTTNLLRVYPEFDETPHVKMPEKYVWPNPDGLYCKSYCPLHPGVHKVVFELVNEICDVFETDAFHAGMDEVFYIGDDKCPRCKGRDKADLFANEVNTIRNFLAQKNRRLWIWGDRLLDGRNTGVGLWEGSYNNTHQAIKNIVRDVVICDWHYERPDQTAVLFAYNGFDVVTCPWRNPGIAVKQLEDMLKYRASTHKDVKEHFQGMLQTVWSGAGSFLDEFYGRKMSREKNTAVNCFKILFSEIKNIDN